jgi:predicted phosphate transport protein (TIGR00153 family)
MRIPLANLLVRSPLPRIGGLMEEVDRCVACVPLLIERLIEGDSAGIERIAREVSILEGKADNAKNELRAKMPVRLFLPVDRRDFLRLISEIDAVADCAEDVGVLLTLRPYEVPEALKPVVREFVSRVMATVKEATELVGMMDELMHAGFTGTAAEAAVAKANEIGRLEHEADKQQDRCAKTLFRAEGEMSPVAIFMWTKLLNKIGDIANHAENVGDQFRLFVAAS